MFRLKNKISTFSGVIRRHSHLNLAIADQAMVSGVNFSTGIILARSLGLQEFGIFTLVSLPVLLFSNIQLALIISPMMSIGPKQPKKEEPAYYGSMIIHQVIFSIISFLLLFVGVKVCDFFSPHWQISHLALPLASLIVAFQMQDFMRRYFFARDCAVSAFTNDSISYLGQIAVLLFLFHTSLIDTVGALWVITGTSLLAVLIGMFGLRRLSWNWSVLCAVTNRHLQFSKWLGISSLMQLGAVNFFVMVAASLWGASAAGALKAAQNIVGITHILFQGLFNVVPLEASRTYHQHGHSALFSYLCKITLLGGGATLLLVVLAGVFPEFWLNLFYGNEYIKYGSLLRWYAMVYMLAFLSVPLHAWLKALEYTRPIFLATFGMLLFSLISARALSKWWKLDGTMAGMLISFIILQSILAISAFRKYKETIFIDENDSV